MAEDDHSSDDGGFAEKGSIQEPSFKSSSAEDQIINHMNSSREGIPEIEHDAQAKAPKENGTPKHQSKNGHDPKMTKKTKDKTGANQKQTEDLECPENDRKSTKLSSAVQKIKDWKRWRIRRHGHDSKKDDVESGRSPETNLEQSPNKKVAKLDSKESKPKLNGDESKKDINDHEATEEESKSGDAPSKNEEKQAFWQRIMALPTRARVLITGSLLFILVLLIVVLVLSHMPANKRKGPVSAPQMLALDPVAGTSCGQVRGKLGPEGSFEFYGIPYALPPIRRHRFKPPRRPSSLDECWHGTLNVIFPPPLCPQPKIVNMPEIKYSEDCLTLDVMSPQLSPYSPLPVVVYVPGMSMMGFSEIDMKYTPNGMVASELNTVFVTIRYRTGVFGFMATEKFAKDSYPKVSGNYGLHDIIAALNWVKTNIRNFGGDPNRVTVLGHGSSATLILSLMASPKLYYQHRELKKNKDMIIESRKFFHQAWLSGGSVNFPNQSLQQSYAENSEFMENLKCVTVQCVQESSVDDILAATPKSWHSQYFLEMPSSSEQYPRIIVKDGVIIQDTPVEAIEKNKLAKIPTVFGSILHEFEPTQAPNLNSWEDFSSFIQTKLQVFDGNLAEETVNLYTDKNSTPIRQYYSMVTDIRITCPMQQFADKFAKYYDKDSIYKYMIHYQYSQNGYKTKVGENIRTGTHGIDIAAIFRQVKRFLNDYYINSEWLLEVPIQRAFFDFIYGSNKQYDLHASKNLNLIGNDGRLNTVPGNYGKCKLWNKYNFVPKYGRVN